MSQDGTPDGTAPTAPAARVRWLRGDVDGLRAVAIVLVVLFHADVPALSNGFIGVDVFFVISGYLITRNLLRDTADGTRVGLLDFWARRLRRLVPALALVVATTLVLSVLVLPTFQLRDTAVQGMAAALYVSNLLFASQSQGYFAEDVEASPFLHTWSLGIEEQFYLFWPVLFVAAILLARRWWPDRQRTVLVAGFAVTLVGSMAVNLWLTAEQSPWAFYGLPSRAWEFAAAGLLAALPVGALVRRRAVGAGLAVGGLALLVVALVAIPDDAVYPGWWAVLPVAATVVLILAGTPDATDGGTNPVSGAMGIRPLQWLGRLSYSWYLWHWPAMVLAAAWWGEDTVQLRLVAGAVSLAVAWLAYRFVENPVRFSRPLMASLGRTYALALLATLVVVGVAAAVRSVPERDRDDGGLAAQALEARDSWRHTFCSTRATIAGVDTCINGDVDAERDLLVLGDSHGAQWKPAIDAWGESNGVRVVEDIRFACPAIGVPVTNRRGDEDNQADCAAAWDERRQLIDELRPEVVLVAQWQGYLDRIIDDGGSSPPVTDRLERWRAAYDDLVTTVAAADAGLVAVLDEPELEDDPLACIDRQRALDPCAVPRDEALERIAPLRSVEVAVLAGYGGLPRLDMVERLCDDQRCAVGLSGTLAYADRQHLTEAFVTENGAWLADLLSEALAGGPPVAGAGDPSEATALDLLDAQLAAAPGSYRHPECRAEEVLAGVEVCVVGDPAAERTVLVVGDSHAGQWKPALDELGRAEGVRVVEHLIPNCPAIGVEVTNRDGDADRQAACAAAWDERRDLLGEVRPDVVLVAQWAGYLPRIVGPDGARPTADEAAARWQDAYEELVATVEASGAALVVVLDEPTLDEDPVTCIDEAGLEACTPTRDGALAATVELRDAELAALDGAPDVRRVDLVDVLCDAETCTLRSRDALVFADRQHLTESFVVSHPELVTEPVLAALADGGG